MPLTTVTITGADETVKPDELRKLSAEFPFVEWGILVGSHCGERFPSIGWIHDLIECRCDSGNTMKLSLHVCGKYLREIAAGNSSLDSDHGIGVRISAFSRVQLNWHGERQPPTVAENVLTAFCRMDTFGWDPQIIFQFDGVNDSLWEPAGRRFAVSGLFDTSHGAGVVPGEWPNASTEIGCGWAGGLGPGNLADEIPRINAKAFPAMGYWIDMETRVRKAGSFDLDKVRACLEISREFVAATSSSR